MLKYNGRGFLPGIPARDLQELEIETLCQSRGITRKFLTESGCYSESTNTTTIKTRTMRVTHDNDHWIVRDEEK